MKKIIHITLSHSSSAPAHIPDICIAAMNQSQHVCRCCPGIAHCMAPSVQGHPTARTPPPWGRGVKVTRSHARHFLRMIPCPYSCCRYSATTGPCSKSKGGGGALPAVPSGCTCAGSPDPRAALVRVHLGHHRALAARPEQPPGPPAEPQRPPACSAPRSLNTSSPSLPLQSVHKKLKHLG